VGGQLLGAPMFWGIGVWLYFAIANLEETGGSIKVNWFIALDYKLGGRWGAVILCVVLGGLFLAWGIASFKNREN